MSKIILIALVALFLTSMGCAAKGDVADDQVSAPVDLNKVTVGLEQRENIQRDATGIVANEGRDCGFDIAAQINNIKPADLKDLLSDINPCPESQKQRFEGPVGGFQLEPRTP